MNDAFEANDGEEPGAETGQPGQEQDGERQQGLPAGRLRQAAGQTSSRSPGVAPPLRDRGGAATAAAAPSVPRVRRSRVQRGLVFSVRNRVMMLRHIHSCRGERASEAQRSGLSLIFARNQVLLPPFRRHAPLPKPLCNTTFHLLQAPEKHWRAVSNFPTLL